MQLLRKEVRVLRGEIERVTMGKKEMALRLESLNKDTSRSRTENEQLSVLTDELDAVTGELMHARSLSLSLSLLPPFPRALHMVLTWFLKAVI